MKAKTCSSCGSRMKRNGKTAAGTQRWRCVSCGSSGVHGNDVSSRDLKRFVRWLLSKERQLDMPGGGRTFRRHAERLWRVWPIPDYVDEVHRVVFVDGIWLGRDAVVLIARSESHVLSWHLARSESSRAYEALLSNVAPPDMVVTDGGPGFAKAASRVWPETKVQRCLFHVFCQVRRCTTTRPNLQAGKEIYQLSKELMRIKTLREADEWVERFLQWCDFWNGFLDERTRTERGWEYTHERLRRARRGIVSLLNKGTLFSYLDPELTVEGPLPSTNNMIEGGTNAKIREMLRNHRGLSLTRRVKAAFWLCYMDTECPRPAGEILESMPTDDDVEVLRELYGVDADCLGGPEEWGSGLAWTEFHHATRYPFSVD